MGDGNSETMNLDLNLGPTSPPGNDPLTSVSLSLEDWIEIQNPSIQHDQSSMTRMPQSWHTLFPAPVPFETRNIASEFLVNTATREGSFILIGEGSERNDYQMEKECNKKEICEEDGESGGDEEEEKVNGEEGSFFECNICLDISSDPVLTCCGHLFCWPCLYQWLNVHSDAKECPVCKGEVTTKNLTPIYGRGSKIQENDGKKSVKIPERPPARRVESWRQTIWRSTFSILMDEMIRRLGSGSDLSREFGEVQPQGFESLDESPERSSLLLNRILTSRGMRQEQIMTTVPPEDIVDVDSTQNNSLGDSSSFTRRSNAYLQRSRSTAHRRTPELLNISQGLMESYMPNPSAERGQDQPLPVDDRDSVSSIAAAIHSENQTLDTAAEIESTVSRSTSLRRPVHNFRASDVDIGNIRALRRRRLN